ncbi:MAG: hypothetical protein K2O00_00325 [Muribaculaceae bacterium]|nr:hypothetical protein [Muribaculaceae bacterium]
MKKFLYLLLLPLIAVAFSSCDDNNEPIDTKLIVGQWEIVSADHPEYTCIYNFTTQNQNTWSWGTLTTYYLTVSGNPVYDKVYSWHISDPQNDDTVYLETTLQGELDSDDAWGNTDYFIVEKLTSTEMTLRRNTVGDSRTKIKFLRRNDLKLP